MKISDATQLPSREGCSSEKASRQNPSGFQQVFQNMFDRPQKDNPAPSAITQSSFPPPLTANAVEAFNTDSGVQVMEEFIDSLAAYQKKLENPLNTLRDIEPELNRLEKEHRYLSRWSNNTDGESPLKSIINEGLVTATLEISRFRSGNYC